MSGLDAVAIAQRRKQDKDAKEKLQRLEALLAKSRSGSLKLPDGGAKLTRNISELKAELALQERHAVASIAAHQSTVTAPVTASDDISSITAAIGQLTIFQGQPGDHLSAAQLRQRVATQEGCIKGREEGRFATMGISLRHGKLGPLGGRLDVEAVARTRRMLEAEEAAARAGRRKKHLPTCARPLELEEEQEGGAVVPWPSGADGAASSGADMEGVQGPGGEAVQGPEKRGVQGPEKGSLQGPGGVAEGGGNMSAAMPVTDARIPVDMGAASAGFRATAQAMDDAAAPAMDGGDDARASPGRSSPVAGGGNDAARVLGGINGAPRKAARLTLSGMELLKDKYGARETRLLSLEEASQLYRRSCGQGMDVEELPEEMSGGAQARQPTRRPPLPSHAKSPAKTQVRWEAEAESSSDGEDRDEAAENAASRAYQDACYRGSTGDGESDENDVDSGDDSDSEPDADAVNN